jgi:ABC-type nitrate/sulfonate/bicarbonate transport system substrate-binding protein
VYQNVTGWESFEPWLSRVEGIEPAMIQNIAGDVPPEWTGNDWGALEMLAEKIVERRSKVRELIAAFRNSQRQPFPAWGTAETTKASTKKLGVQ